MAGATEDERGKRPQKKPVRGFGRWAGRPLPPPAARAGAPPSLLTRSGVPVRASPERLARSEGSPLPEGPGVLGAELGSAAPLAAAAAGPDRLEFMRGVR